MSAAGGLLTEDRFLCSVCLDVLTDPVSTPCGHNFCKTCISRFLNRDAPFQCPVCQTMFFPSPELQVNRLLAELVHVWRRSAGGGGPEPGGVRCDACSGSKRRALVFCLLWAVVCLVFSQNKPELPLMEEVKLSSQLSEEDACRHRTAGLLHCKKGHSKNNVEELVEMRRTSEMELEQKFTAIMRREIPKLLLKGELMRAQRYAVDVSLDPETANPDLVLSADGKQVGCRSLHDDSERSYVLGKQSFFGGRFYFEVQVRGKTAWTVGVAEESSSRRRAAALSGRWTVRLKDGSEYRALAGRPVRLAPRSPPEKLGVFVDYEEGLVFFYDVDAAALIHSFTGCSFTERLRPFFHPGLNDDGGNSAPLVITPVNHSQ